MVRAMASLHLTTPHLTTPHLTTGFRISPPFAVGLRRRPRRADRLPRRSRAKRRSPRQEPCRRPAPWPGQQHGLARTLGYRPDRRSGQQDVTDAVQSDDEDALRLPGYPRA